MFLSQYLILLIYLSLFFSVFLSLKREKHKKMLIIHSDRHCTRSCVMPKMYWFILHVKYCSRFVCSGGLVTLISGDYVCAAHIAATGIHILLLLLERPAFWKGKEKFTHLPHTLTETRTLPAEALLYKTQVDHLAVSAESWGKKNCPSYFHQ